MADSLKGKLLVAQPSLMDPNFHRAVVLVVEHGEDGAVGVILNRPSETPMIEALPDWAALAAPPARVFVGGPVVDGGAAICLARIRGELDEDSWSQIMEGVGTLAVNRAPEEVGPGVEEVRLFAGYAGWTKDQLEGEVEESGWFIVPARPADIFTTDPEGLWKAVLGRQHGMLAWFAGFPPDPVLN